MPHRGLHRLGINRLLRNILHPKKIRNIRLLLPLREVPLLLPQDRGGIHHHRPLEPRQAGRIRGSRIIETCRKHPREVNSFHHPLTRFVHQRMLRVRSLVDCVRLPTCFTRLWIVSKDGGSTLSTSLATYFIRRKKYQRFTFGSHEWC